MNRQWIILLAGLALLQGCATTDRQAIPVVDASTPVSETGNARQTNTASALPKATQATRATPQPTQQDAGVVVMVPQGADAPLQISSAPVNSLPSAASTQIGTWNTPPQTSAPTNAPSTALNRNLPITTGGSNLAADEQLDGPVLALLTTAQQQQGGGDLNGAVSSLERAQRIAPREPQVLYRLAQIRLNQGDAAQAEQLSRRALSYAAGRPTLQAGLWELIAQAREKQGDAAGAAQARQRARVNL